MSEREEPSVSEAPQLARGTRQMASFLASWRTALRVARREARRAKWRSTLVVAMIALPVLFLSFAAVSYDMFSLTGSETADQTMGTGTARIQWDQRGSVLQMPNPADGYYTDYQDGGSGGPGDGPSETKPPTQADLLALLPAGSTALEVQRGVVNLKITDGIARLNAIAVDADQPVTRGYVSILDGRAPTVTAEVALTEQAMQRLGVGIGGTVTLGDGTHPYKVVGQVEFPSMLEETALFVPQTDPPDDLALHDRSWIVTTPAPIQWSDVLSYNKKGLVVTSRAVLIDPPADDQVPYLQNSYRGGLIIQAQEVGFTVLIAGLALLEIVLMAGPAFAVSARRRQRQLALVAANGGTAAHVRRIVLADGVVLGVVGAVVGIILGIAAAFIARPFLETWLAHFRAGGYRVFPVALLAIALLAVVTGLLAALVPAFVTARQNIITSLAGRRGITRSRKRWLVLGLVMTAGGAAIVMYGTSRVDRNVMLAGLVVGELGLVLCTPSLVGLIARVGRVLPLGPRVALRDAARNRAAAAPAISAVMAAVAGSVAIGLYLASSTEQQREAYTPQVPVGYVQVYLGSRTPNPTQAQLQARADQLSTALRATLPVTDTKTISSVVCPPGTDGGYCDLSPQQTPERVCPYIRILETEQRNLTKEEADAARKDPRCDTKYLNMRGGVVVDDGSALAILTGATGDDLARARATLQAGGIVVRDDSYIKDGKVSVMVINQTSKAPFDPATAPKVELPAYLLTTGIPGSSIISPAAVATAGLSTQPVQLVAATSRPPTQVEIDRALGQVRALETDMYVEDGPPIVVDVRIWILVAAAAAITLAAAGVGTGLAAADGRQDLSTLAAVGASPRLRRVLSLSQSAVIAGLGSILGALAGIGAAIAIVVSLNVSMETSWPGPTPMPIELPWLSLAISLVVVPLIAMLGAGSFTRSRLPVERRL